MLIRAQPNNNKLVVGHLPNVVSTDAKCPGEFLHKQFKPSKNKFKGGGVMPITQARRGGHQVDTQARGGAILMHR